MSTRKHIVDSIDALAKRMRRTPSLLEFAARTRVTKHSVLRHFSRWNEAIKAAGLEPCRVCVRPANNDLLKDWAEVVRKKRGLPSRSAYLVTGKYYTRTIEKRFGGWPAVPEAFRKFAKGKREWADMVALLAAGAPNEKLLTAGTNPQGCCRLPSRQARHALQHWLGGTGYATLRDRATYGNPMDFRGMRHEPVDDQGVVLLFGEAKRRIAPGRWQRVRIEFEFESKNFRQHGHPVTGCDVIVCWRHNWNDHPKHIEILELASVIKSLAGEQV